MKRMKILVAALGISVGTMGFTTSALAEYGAIAFNQDTEAWGYSWGFSSRRGAEREALDQCGRNCEIAVWYEEGCGAVAMGWDGGAGWGPGSSIRRAERVALRQCESVDYDCEILISACSWD